MLSELRRIGLTQYEAKIYKTILSYGQSNAREIAKLSRVPQTAVYPNLKALLDKELIVKLEAKVASYKALPPQTAITRYIEQKQKHFSSIAKEAITQAKNIRQRKQFDTAKEVVKISLGKQASVRIYEEFSRKSTRSLYVMGWTMRKVGDKYLWLKLYRKMVRAGVDVRIIVTGKGKKQKEVIEAYQEAGIKVRFLPLENFSLAVSDGKVCKITLKGKDLKQKFNMQIDDLDLSKAMESYFLMSWEKSNTQMPV